MISNFDDIIDSRDVIARIDWDATAENVKQDYTAIAFGDTTYWVR